ncbi:cupin [Jannaschia sp. M317]|nr:cupin [Jannaschia sp. M317]
MNNSSTTGAEIVLPAPDLGAELAFWTARGFRLDAIWPADDPEVARLSGLGLCLRLVRGAKGAVTLRLTEGAAALSPGGTRVEVGTPVPVYALPPVQTGFGLRRLSDGDPWVIGRAGMQYRDLVPDRLGGAVIASHIRIPDGGPVPDMVHYHTVGFQLIFCHRGWVDLIYEDQGPAFRLEAGGCVIQPPEIRHRVLHASDNIEVVEVGVPAVHVTTMDHEMVLPNGPANPARRFQGQRFLHHRAAEATWRPGPEGFVTRETGVADATRGVAGVRVLRAVTDAGPMRADAEIHLGFLRSGRMQLIREGQAQSLSEGDAFVLAPAEDLRFAGATEDLEILTVTLPAGGAAA